MKKYSYLSLIIGIILLSYILLSSISIECENYNEIIIIPEGSSVSTVASLLYEKDCFSYREL